MKTHHPKIFIGKIATYPKEEVLQILTGFKKAVDGNDEQQIRRLFNQILPEASLSVDESTPQPKIMPGEAKLLARPSKLGLVEK